MTNPVSLGKYGGYKGHNYGSNAMQLLLPWITVWFSYSTPIAFDSKRFKHMVIRENDWNQTTGKHLRWAQGNVAVIEMCSKDFEAALEEALLPNHSSTPITVIEKAPELIIKWKTKPCQKCEERKRRTDMQETRGQSLVL